MPYVLPTFNLLVNIWRTASAVPHDRTVPDVITVGNLSQGRRVQQSLESVPGVNQAVVLFPQLTDVRAQFNGITSDVLEVPAGSGRFYVVYWVDDFGKGFANEHRYAFAYLLTSGITFTVQGLIPLPVPLP